MIDVGTWRMALLVFTKDYVFFIDFIIFYKYY